MTFPLIDKVYEYNNRKEIVWAQDIFVNVYLRSIPENDNESSQYTQINWWKFMFSAKKLKISFEDYQ